MSETYLQIIVILLIVLIIAILALIGSFAFMIFRRAEGKSTPSVPLPRSDSAQDKKHEENSRSEEVVREHNSSKPEKNPLAPAIGICFKHPEQIAVSACAICAQLLCENCVREHETLQFCPEHFEMFLNYKWVEIETVATTPQTPERGMYLYEFKERSWNDSGKPSYIMTHYKINVENDLIESYIKLYVREEDIQELKAKIRSS